MNPRKLAFGDLVYSTFNYGYVRIRNVADLEYSAYYQPIPLAGDILEKNGFTGNSLGRYSLHKDGNEVTIKLSDDFSIYVKTSTCSLLYKGVIEHVHELQQLMRAVGLKELANVFSA